MAMNMRCRDQSWSGRAVDCFDIGIECGREIHGENEVLLKFKFCEGKGDISLWNEVWRDDWVMMMMWWSVCGSEILWGEGGYVSMLGGLCEDWCDVVMYCIFSTIQISCDEWPTISMKWSLYEQLCDVVMPLSFLYNSNFMRWMTNYLYEMRLEWIVVWESSCTMGVSFSL